MGYTTEFDGEFTLNKPLDEETQTYLENFAQSRRMKRDPQKLEEMGFGPAASFGVEGEFFVNEDDVDNYGQTRDDSILDYNRPPSTQPGLWCQWVPNENGDALVWDEGEKFYHAAEWIKYLIDAILAPKGYVLNGVVDARGEEFGDLWYIEVTNNVVKTGEGHYNQQDKWNQLERYVGELRAAQDEKQNEEAIRILRQVQTKIDEIR